MTGSLADDISQSAADYWVLFLASSLVSFIQKKGENSSAHHTVFQDKFSWEALRKKKGYFILFWYTTDYGGFISNTQEGLVIFQMILLQSLSLLIRLSICTVKFKISGDARAVKMPLQHSAKSLWVSQMWARDRWCLKDFVKLIWSKGRNHSFIYKKCMTVAVLIVMWKNSRVELIPFTYMIKVKKHLSGFHWRSALEVQKTWLLHKILTDSYGDNFNTLFCLYV